MFPQTPHIECVALLERASGIDLGRPRRAAYHPRAPVRPAGERPRMSARFASLIALLLALGLAAPVVAAADAPLVPMLTGGEAHWVGTAHREYHQRSTDELGGHYNEDDASTVSWDSRLLLPGNYADAPAFTIPDGIVFPTAFKTQLGSGTKHIDELDYDSPGSCEPRSRRTARGPRR